MTNNLNKNIDNNFDLKIVFLIPCIIICVLFLSNSFDLPSPINSIIVLVSSAISASILTSLIFNYGYRK